MKKVSEFFRKSTLSLSQPKIVYKDGNFLPISSQELENAQLDEINSSKISTIIQKQKDNKLSDDKKAIIALKTIATEFDNLGKKTDIEDMTSVLFLPVLVNIKTGQLKHDVDNNRFPWIPREYLSPMIDEEISIGTVFQYDNFLEKTTAQRNQISSWQDYLQYAIDLFEYICQISFNNDFIPQKNSQIKTDGKFYIIEDETAQTTQHIENFYYEILNVNNEPALYAKLSSGQLETSRKHIHQDNIQAMKLHSGQMNGEYPLSPSQREAIHSFQAIQNGEVLAVQGPPGTGKTTLLQSVVADMVVQAALKQDKAPIIVAVSTNNQAVTNIIDSFEKIPPIGIHNLEQHWISKVRSFAIYLPSSSSSKIKEAQVKNYHITNQSGEFFVSEIESEEYREQAKKEFQADFCQFFNIDKNLSLNDMKNIIYNRLVELNNIRFNSIKSIEELLSYKKPFEYLQIIKKKITIINAQIDTNKKMIKLIDEQIKLFNDKRNYFINCINKWKEIYNQLPFYVRLLKFISAFKRKIQLYLYQNMQSEELEFLHMGMDVVEIEQQYIQKISENDLLLKKEKEKLMEEKEKTIELQSLLEKAIKEEKTILHLIEKSKNNLKECFYQAGIKVIKEKNIEEEIDKLFNINNQQLDIHKINNYLDSVRYVQFRLATHYYESRWLIEDWCVQNSKGEYKPITEKQKGKNFENVLRSLYQRIAMLTPCMVMTCFMIPKHFLAFDGNENKKYHLYNIADLLIVDEAGQISPEIGLPAFAFAKKAIVVGDEEQIPPVWGTSRVLDMTLAIDSKLVNNKSEYEDILIENGLNCSQSNIMKIATRSCKFDKYNKGLFLSEHRRCFDEIIQYSNQLVYQGRLEPLRGSCHSKNNKLMGYLPAMGYKQITSAYSQRIGTSRQNKNEANAILVWLCENYHHIVEKYRSENEENLIGIITPFKVQSSLINRVLKNELPEHIYNNITVGTVHTFQGAERKIILFSSVYGHQENCSFINRDKSMMNVAVSRAKDSFLVFGDINALKGSEQSAAILLKNAIRNYGI